MTQPGYQKREGKFEGLSTNLVQPKLTRFNKSSWRLTANGYGLFNGMIEDSECP
jgi:hypothetical protein